MNEQQAIKVFLEQRNINKLYHFTRVENLSGILENGLLPVRELQRSFMQYINVECF